MTATKKCCSYIWATTVAFIGNGDDIMREHAWLRFWKWVWLEEVKEVIENGDKDARD